MLNISENSVHAHVEQDRYSSLRSLNARHSGKTLIKVLTILFGTAFLFLFLPWTQNISGRGNLTALKPDQRPQTVHSVIAGRIEKWFVQEGDQVKKGDTIIYVSEIKDDYFDPNLLARTQEQLKSKQQAVVAYGDKVKALDNQIEALSESSRLKLEQTQNKLKQAKLKVTSDSIDYQAAITNYQIAREQYERMAQMHKEGLKSLTDLENRRLTMQKAQAYMISAESKVLVSRNEVLNARVELSSVLTDYRDKISKAESDKFTALSSKFDAEATASKLQNQYMNYSVRTGLYYITAPQDGYVTKAIQSGIGETIKEGEAIVSIMPSKYDLAIEMYVKPLDLPLLEKGQHVRIRFDGWPAIVFSGWPNTSYGTFGGQVYAIDNYISDNGKYRVLVAPDPNDHPWPAALRVGAGTDNMLLLKDVPIWYELWRNINGFPADYYKENKADTPGAKTEKTEKK